MPLRTWFSLISTVNPLGILTTSGIRNSLLHSGESSVVSREMKNPVYQLLGTLVKLLNDVWFEWVRVLRNITVNRIYSRGSTFKTKRKKSSTVTRNVSVLPWHVKARHQCITITWHRKVISTDTGFIYEKLGYYLTIKDGWLSVVQRLKRDYSQY